LSHQTESKLLIAPRLCRDISSTHARGTRQISILHRLAGLPRLEVSTRSSQRCSILSSRTSNWWRSSGDWYSGARQYSHQQVQAPRLWTKLDQKSPRELTTRCGSIGDFYSSSVRRWSWPNAFL